MKKSSKLFSLRVDTHKPIYDSNVKSLLLCCLFEHAQCKTKLSVHLSAEACPNILVNQILFPLYLTVNEFRQSQKQVSSY